eukprot:COSAG01_NODE_27000_length_697_cov_1.030100_2_plen_104_part_01
MCAEGYYNASLGSFKCVESDALDYVNDTTDRLAGTEGLLDPLRSPCVPCQGSCVVCGLKCSLSPRECGRVSVRAGFALYLDADEKQTVTNDITLAEYFQGGAKA